MALDGYLMHTYQRDLMLVRGEGTYLFDAKGKKYLDLIGSLATCSVGHSNQELAAVMAAQAQTLVNTTNLFHVKPQLELAKKLCNISGMSRCFFSNSGTEAMECAIKLAMKHTGRSHFIAMQQSFHGRTIGSLSATWKESIRAPFKALLGDFSFVAFGDLAALREAIRPETAAVILEPIQGESGIFPAPVGYLKGVWDLAKERGILMIVDEIQTGNGRTGKYFCYQHENILPDIVTTAKGLANGLPIGATLSSGEIDFAPGDHGSTFGGNAFCTAVAQKTVELIEDVLPAIPEKSHYFITKLSQLPHVKEVRGKGFMLALGVDQAQEIAKVALEKGLLLNCPNPQTLRLLPPLTITQAEMDEAVQILADILEKR